MHPPQPDMLSTPPAADQPNGEHWEVMPHRLKQGLARLIPVERALILLRHRDRLSAQAIADALGIPTCEVELRLVRAVERLTQETRSA